MPLGDLKRLYREAGINAKNNGPGLFGLYLGAGVNLAPIPELAEYTPVRTYCWTQLLEEMHTRLRSSQRRRGALQTRRPDVSFDELAKKYGSDWPGLAAKICQGVELPDRKQLIDELFYEGFSRGDKDRRLPRSFLSQAPTLHAAICFSAAIHRVENAKIKGSWGFERNPALAVVITPNYDFFFGAGWTSYQCFPWHAVTSASHRANESIEEGAIYYLHGYIPYRHFALLRPEDLPNAPELAKELLLSADPIPSLVRERACSEQLKILEDKYRRAGCSCSATAAKGLMRAVKNVLDAVIINDCLVDTYLVCLRKLLLEEGWGRTPQDGRDPGYHKRVMLLSRFLLQATFPEYIKPPCSELVLTSEEYDEAYEHNAFARRILTEAIEKYHLIFLGTSFTDQPLRDSLINHKNSGASRTRHFVIAPRSDSMNEDEAAKLGLDWIDAKSYEGIPEILKEVYCHDLEIPSELQGLDPEGTVGKINTPGDYWEVLEYGPRKKGRKSKQPQGQME